MTGNTAEATVSTTPDTNDVTYNIVIAYSDGSEVKTQVKVPRQHVNSGDIITGTDGKTQLSLAEILTLASSALQPADIGKTVAGLTAITEGETTHYVINDLVVHTESDVDGETASSFIALGDLLASILAAQAGFIPLSAVGKTVAPLAPVAIPENGDTPAQSVNAGNGIIIVMPGADGLLESVSLADFLAGLESSDAAAGAYVAKSQIGVSVAGLTEATVEDKKVYVLDDQMVTNSDGSEAQTLHSALSALVTSEALIVALKAFVTSDALAAALKTYITEDELNATLKGFVTSDALATALKSYVTSDALTEALKDYTTSEALTEALKEYVTSEALTTELKNYIPSDAVGVSVAGLTEDTIDSKTVYLADDLEVSAVDDKGATYAMTLAAWIADVITRHAYNAPDGVPQLDNDGSLFSLAADDAGDWYTAGTGGPDITTGRDNSSTPSKLLTENLGVLIGKLFAATENLQNGKYTGDLGGASITGTINGLDVTIDSSRLFNSFLQEDVKGAEEGYVPTQADVGLVLQYAGTSTIAQRTIDIPTLCGSLSITIVDPNGSLWLTFQGYLGNEAYKTHQVYLSAGDTLDLNSLWVGGSTASKFIWRGSVRRVAAALIPGTTKPEPTDAGGTGEIRIPGDGYRYECIQGSANGVSAKWIRTAIETTW